MRINLQNFLKDSSLKFDSERQSISWVKRNLKPTTLLRVGPNYLVDQKEIEKLFKGHLLDQEKLRFKRSEVAKKLKKKKINELIKKRSKNES